MQSQMPNDSRNRAPREDPPYRVYTSDSAAPPRSKDRPYNTYRSAPRGLRARLRGEDDTALADRGSQGGDRDRGPDQKVKEGWRGRITVVSPEVVEYAIPVD